jgi:DNA-binding FadR family transcriptional regulator
MAAQQEKQYGSDVRVPKAASLVAASLRQQIIRGSIGDGEPLPTEPELMAQFGVSRPTLREAMRVLESENLISVRRGSRGGPVAHQIRADLVSRYASLLLQSLGTTLADVYQAQITFEPACVRDLATSRTDRDLRVLRMALASEDTGMEDAGATRARVGFHYLLIELTANQTLMLLSRLVSDVLLSATGAEIGLGHLEAHRDHVTLVDLIEARDADGAHDLWRSHLERARERALHQAGGDRPVLDAIA